MILEDQHMLLWPIGISLIMHPNISFDFLILCPLINIKLKIIISQNNLTNFDKKREIKIKYKTKYTGICIWSTGYWWSWLVPPPYGDWTELPRIWYNGWPHIDPVDAWFDDLWWKY